MLIPFNVLKSTYILGVADQRKYLSIKGSVKKMGVPLLCRVRLHESISGTLVMETMTDKDGNYEFTRLARLKFFIVAHDPASQFNAVIQDNVVPK
jgi:hypothetical protein